MRSDERSVRWEKVDDATDLSYVTEQMGNLKSYSFDDFALRGIYGQDVLFDTETQQYSESPYQYYFVVIDTADGISAADVCYALKNTPHQQVRETLPFYISDDGLTLTVGEQIWSSDTYTRNSFTRMEGNVKWTLNLHSYSVTESALDDLVESYLAVDEV